MHFLPGKKGKWSTENIDQKTNEEVEKLYNIYMEWQTQVKGEMTGRAMGGHLIKLYSNGVNKFLEIDNDIEQLLRDMEEDPIIKDSMANISALMVSTFGKWVVTRPYRLSYGKSYERLCVRRRRWVNVSIYNKLNSNAWPWIFRVLFTLKIFSQSTVKNGLEAEMCAGFWDTSIA